MVIFLYNLYILVIMLVKHGCLAKMVFALDPSNSVIKRLWCIGNQFLQASYSFCLKKKKEFQFGDIILNSYTNKSYIFFFNLVPNKKR